LADILDTHLQEKTTLLKRRLKDTMLAPGKKRKEGGWGIWGASDLPRSA